MKKQYFSPEMEIASLRLEAIMDNIRPSDPDPVPTDEGDVPGPGEGGDDIF